MVLRRVLFVGLLVGCSPRSDGPWADDHGIALPAASTGAGAMTADDGDDRGDIDGSSEGADPSEGADMDDAGPKLDVGTEPLPPGACPCAPFTDLVIVLSSSGELWTYDPKGLAFVALGPANCPVFSPTSFSLAVARDATAYVEFEATGDIYEVDLVELGCRDPGYEPPASEPRRFGLGFVANGDESSCEQLLGWSYDGDGWSEGPGAGVLTRIEIGGPERTVIARIPYNGGELSGTGDGRLFAIAGVSPAKLVELDRSSGAVLDVVPLPGVELTHAFAMAFWGGDIHLFTESSDDPSRSRVLRYDLDGSDGDEPVLSVEVSAAPIRIVGAATSTCAPTTPAG